MDLITKLLSRQVDFYPVIISQEEVAQDKKGFNTLKDLGVVERMSTAYQRLCPTCNSEYLEAHVVSASRAYTLCTQQEESGRDYFDPEELYKWLFSMSRLLNLIQTTIGIGSQTLQDHIPGLLWGLGMLRIDGIDQRIFFCRDIDEIDKPRLSIFINRAESVILYTGTPHIALPDENKTLLVALSDVLVGVKNNKIDFDSKQLKKIVSEAFRQVAFIPLSGELLVRSQSLGIITPSSPEYYFLDILWRNFNKPVSHDAIFAYIKKHLHRDDYSITPAALCHKKMSAIRKLLGKVVDTFIISTATVNGENAYQMISPR